MRIAGSVSDDSARSMASDRVAIAVARANDEKTALPLADAAPEACGGTGAAVAAERADLIVVQTDAAGRFCVRLRLPTDRYVVKIDARAAGFVDGAHAELPIDLALPPVTLRFDPERPWLSLDDESTDFDVAATIDDEDVPRAAARMDLALANEHGDPLGVATTDASGHARFVVPSARLGSPGRGEVRVSFAGSAGAGASSSARAMPIERRTYVDLALPDATDGRLPAGSPEDGITVMVIATARCTKSGVGAVPSGMIEILGADGSIHGAAPVEAGQARVTATFVATGAAEAPLRVRYLPDAPWFEAAAEATAIQPVRAPSPWKQLPLVVASLAVVAWLALARLPPRSLASSIGPSVPGDPRDRASGEARVAVMRKAPATEGWKGRVIDAHDGVAVRGARLWIERRTFDRTEILAQADADDRGEFALVAAETAPGDELVAEGAWHAPLRRPVPPTGDLEIAIVLRKRALVDRLVAWARGRGRPFDARPDPTPGHVRRAASAEFTVARWADAVERAAYGGVVVDERAQSEVDRLAPPENKPDV